MKKLGIATAVAIAAVGAAHAADLPTKKEASPAPPVNCFASLWTWLNSTPADCPLSWGPFTAYATLDGGFTYSQRRPYNARWNNGVDSFIQKQSYGAKWLQSPNNLSQSVAGIKMSQPLPFLSGPFLSGWSIVGTWEWGFNPYYGFPAAAQQSQVNQNGRALLLQGAGADFSRTGQPDNSQAFIGLSNPTYGTLTPAASTRSRSTRSTRTIRWAAPTPSRRSVSRAPSPASATPRRRAPILPSSTG